MSNHLDGYALHWPKWSVTARFLRRMAVGLLAVASLLWFAARIEEISSQRGIETSRATGLSVIVPLSHFTPILAKRVFSEARVAQSAVSPEGTRIARTASLRIFVRNFSAARESVDRIVRTRGGFAASMTISSPKDSSRSLSADFAIPTAQCDAALQEFRSLGRVEEEHQGSEEVTAQSEDLDIRLKNARETEIRLTNILRVGTGKVSDVLEVENEITRVREEIERMEAEQKRLNSRVVFASIDLSLTEEFQAEPGIRSSQLGLRMRNAFIDGYRGAADGVLNVLEILLSTGPSLFLWGLILFWPARWAWRRWQKSRAQSEARA
ncbi:MAG TPA: DUF4349 domain-containing protein [Verrucomicrobiae bacterium]|nr:DUF4349 domain-containing protein [Verrucomicrobiae bacterium]